MSMSMKIRLLLRGALLCLSGCDSVSDPPPQITDEPILGGSIALSTCGYRVTTREGATAPVPGQPSLGPQPTPFAVHLGLAGDPTRTMNVIWRTRDDQTLVTQVQFGEGPRLDRVVDGVTFRYETLNQAVRIHETHLCGLKPGTEYSYRVGGQGANGDAAWSPIYTFRTAPDLAQNPGAGVLVALLGDTRGDYAKWGQVLRLADQKGPPDVILFSGDAVTLGTLQSEWDDFFAQAEPVLSHVPMVNAHGNHEANAINYYSQLALPGNEEDFSLDYGAAHVTVLNDTPLNPADMAGRTRDFLDADSKAAKAPWRFAMHHIPMWSAGTGHGGDTALRALWGPVVDANKLDLVLNGHEHSYERTRPLRGSVPQASPANGTIYLIAGGGGAPLYEAGRGEWTEVIESTNHMVLLKIMRRSLEVRAYRDNGTLLDSFTLMK